MESRAPRLGSGLVVGKEDYKITKSSRKRGGSTQEFVPDHSMLLTTDRLLVSLGVSFLMCISWWFMVESIWEKRP